MEEVVIDKKRYKYLDVIKVIAIFFVVSYHSFSNYIIIPNNSEATYLINRCISIFFATCVPLFFMVNGALLFNKELNLKQHIIKTLKTFCLIYIWSAILTLVLMPVKGVLSFNQFMNTVLTLKTQWVNHLWFLSQLVLLYILFPLFKYLFDRDKNYFIIFLCFCFFFAIGDSIIKSLDLIAQGFWGENNFVSSVLNYGNSFLSKYDPTIKRYSYSMVYFMFGGLIHCYAKNIKEKCANKKFIINLLSIVFILITITCSYFYCESIGIKDVVWNGYSLIFTFINCSLVFLMGIINDNCKNNKFISFISKYIMGIYIIHFAVIPYIRKIFSSVELNVLPLKFPVAIISIGISLLITFILMKIKYIRNLFKL